MTMIDHEEAGAHHHRSRVLDALNGGVKAGNRGAKAGSAGTDGDRRTDGAGQRRGGWHG